MHSHEISFEVDQFIERPESCNIINMLHENKRELLLKYATTANNQIMLVIKEKIINQLIVCRQPGTTDKTHKST